MNLFNEYVKSYIAACFTVAAIYAFVVGTQVAGMETAVTQAAGAESVAGTQAVAVAVALSFALIVVDALVYGGLLCLTGFILWNIYRFATPAYFIPKYNVIAVSAITLLTGIFVTGIEAFVIYLSFPSQFGLFAPTVPVRLLISLLIFTVIRLLYVAYGKKEVAANSADGAPREQTPEKPPMEQTPENPAMERIAEKPAIERITVRVGQKIKIIPVNDVVFIKADGDYISIRTAEGSWLKEQTMNDAENTLPSDRFVRIHRSYIVNVNFISRIERYGEKQQVMLSGGEKIRISAARYRTLKQILGF